MKLDARQFRFSVPFATFSARRLVKLGGKRGSLHLQETALVAEGELLRFTFIIGLEWLFRRALSEWTMVTVPYSRIQTVRISKLWPLRILSALFVVAWIALTAYLWTSDFAPPVMVFGFAGTLLLAYVNLRVRKSIHVEFWRRDRRRRLVFQIPRRALRESFLKTLRDHREAARQFGTTTPATVAVG
jgi:hypothetical protein